MCPKNLLCKRYSLYFCITLAESTFVCFITSKSVVTWHANDHSLIVFRQVLKLLKFEQILYVNYE